MNNMQFVKTSKGIDIRLGGYLSANGTPIATYPIGSIIQTTDADFSPAKEYGGVWERFAKGRVIVGFDEDDVDFQYETDSAGNIVYDDHGKPKMKTGGEKTHKLTTEEMPSHSHLIGTQYPNSSGSAMPWLYYSSCVNPYSWTPSNYTGGNQPHNNLQPYEVAYIWRRVA